MSFSGFIKRHKIAVIVISSALLVCIIGFIVFIAILPRDNDIKYNEAVALARKQFGLDKVLWIDTHAGVFSRDPNAELTPSNMRSHYAYYVVGEKDGAEIYCVVPSNPLLEKPYLTTWNLKYTFSQIIDKFNEHGAGYVIDLSYNNSVEYSSRISIYVDEKTINGYAQDYDDIIVGENDNLYERLDIKVVFFYQWSNDDNKDFSCIVTQENGELKAYVR